MPRVLIIVNHRKDRSPNQRFRIEQYLPYLQQQGFEFDFANLLNEHDDSIFYAPGHYLQKAEILVNSLLKRLDNVIHANNYDIIFIAREAIMIGTSIFERAFAKSKAAVVFDFDDAIWVTKDSGTSAANRNLSWLKNPAKTSRNIACADLVFAGNEYLATYARQFNKNVVVVPTTIDTNWYIPDYSLRSKDKVMIGWTGSHTTIEHFKMAEPVLMRLKEKYGDSIGFLELGDPDYRNKSLGIEGIKWSPQNEVSVLNQCQIGIMPLPDDEWAKGKCGCKGLQYMAVEVATVMAPVGINKDIINQGVNGFLAQSEDEWFDILSLLIEDPALHYALGKEGRKTVLEQYSVLSQRDVYLNQFKSLI